MIQLCSKILMIRAASFGFNNETAADNAFQSSNKAIAETSITNIAIEEFDAAVAKLKKQEIEVIVVQDTKEPIKPDAIFPNNWFCTLPTGELIVFPMYAANRRIEKRDDILHQLAETYAVKNVEDWSEYEAENFFLEGTGSMIFDHDNKKVYACISSRTHKALFEKFASAHGYEPIHFTATDNNNLPIYHTNVMMHVGETYAVICLDTIKDRAEQIFIAQSLTENGHEIIDISFEQMVQFAGNMIQIKNKNGKKYTILSQTAFNSLTIEQKNILNIHTQLLPIAIPTIEKYGGGSARCMIAEVFLNK